MADGGVFDAVLTAWAQPDRYRGFTHLMTEATRANGGRAVHATFETVFISDGHPFDHARPDMLVHARRTELAEIQILHIRDSQGSWPLVALPTAHEGVYHIAGGIPTTHPRWQKITRWIERARHISRCFLDHSDFEAIGDRLGRYGEVEVVHATGRSHRDGSSTFRGFPALASGHRPSHIESIAEFERSDAFVRSLTLRVADQLSMHLRRVAGATYYSGNFGLFEAEVLAPLAVATAGRRALVTGRQRQRDQPVVPLSIVLPSELFQSRDDTGALVELVQGMADMSMAIFHRNPYLHFAMTDESDGSNFDVMITTADRVSVYPGFRASAESLARVTQRIGEAFGAAQIAQAEPAPPVRLADLVGA